MVTDINSEPLNEVLAKYPYTVKSIRAESYKQKKGVWWIETTKGMKILKKHPNSESMLLFLLAAIKHLQNKGISIPKVNAAIDGNLYAKSGDTCFILIDAVEGSNPDYKKPKELEALVRELGRFHAASAGFIPPESAKERRHLGNWLQDYSADLGRLEEQYSKEMNKNIHGEFGKIIMESYPVFLKSMETVIAGLKKPEYAAWVNKTEAAGGLCHQDFAAGNILLGPSGKVYVLDTDSLTVELPARDIRKLINKVMKKNGKWDADVLQNILRWYQQENPLTSDEWAVVKLDLKFPHLFAGIMDKYYRAREKDWTESKYVSRLKEMISMEQSKENALDRYDAIIKSIQ